MLTDSQRIPMFATANDTNRWVVAVDGRFGLFDTYEDAKACYDLIPDGDLGDTPFGSCQLIKPGHRPTMDAGLSAQLGEPQDMTRRLISESKPVDIIGYIKAGFRKRKQCLGHASDRLAERVPGEFTSYARKYILPINAFWSEINQSKEAQL